MSGGTEATVDLKEVGPGHYEGQFAVAAPGAYQVDVKSEDPFSPPMLGTAMLYVSYPAQFDFVRADFDKLRALATATGGKVLIGDQAIFTGKLQWVAWPVWRLWAVVALLLFMLDLAVRHAPNLLGLAKRTRGTGQAAPESA